MYCRQCGQMLSAQAIFCHRCGLAQIHASHTAMADNGKGGRKPVSRKHRLATRFVVLVVLLIGTVLVIWQVGRMTGTWRNLQVRQASSGWQRQQDVPQVRSAITADMADLADQLDDGNLDKALAWIHPDHHITYREQFDRHPGRVSELATALRSIELTFLSSDNGNYESSRMAQITVKMLPLSLEDESSALQDVTVTLILYEDRWVIDS